MIHTKLHDDLPDPTTPCEYVRSVKLLSTVSSAIQPSLNLGYSSLPTCSTLSQVEQKERPSNSSERIPEQDCGGGGGAGHGCSQRSAGQAADILLHLTHPASSAIVLADAADCVSPTNLYPPLMRNSVVARIPALKIPKFLPFYFLTSRLKTLAPLLLKVASYSPEQFQIPCHISPCRLQTLDQRLQIHPAILRPCLLYTSPSPRDRQKSRMPSSA